MNIEKLWFIYRRIIKRKKNGEGKEYSKEKLEYEGNFLFGKKNGKGKLYHIFYDKLFFKENF